MTRFEARAIENIATAPATQLDRRAAIAAAAAVTAVFLLTLPFAAARLDAVPAFLPLVVGVGVLAALLTTLLVFVQYRIGGDAKLALLALAYGWYALTQLCYVLTFPGIFINTGQFGGTQTASAFFIAGHLGFGVLLLLHGLVSRARLHLAPHTVRIVAAACGVIFAVLAVLFFSGRMPLPPVSDARGFSPFLTGVAGPLMIATFLVAAVVVGERFRTVTQVWLAVVLFGKALEIFTSAELATARYSFGWYAARTEGLVATVVLLGVFLVKINDLMLRLAARNQTSAEALAVGEARYTSLANVVPQMIFTTNAQGDVEYVNERWVTYTGYDLPSSQRGGWRIALHSEHEATVGERWNAALRSGAPFAAEVRMREGISACYRWFLVNAVPVRGRRNAVEAWIGTCTDVDAQKRLEEREAFLARAGERLGASLDVVATVAGMKTLLIPRLAERAWIALLDEDGRYILSGIGSTDVGDELDTRRWIGAPLPAALHEAVADYVLLGEPVVLDKPDRFPDPWVRELPAGAAMLVPLVSGEVRIGAIALLRSSGRAYDADDLGIVREFARRAALSLQHARLYERERTTADALQRAMLPAQLPQLPNMHFSASYSAASESQRVGGDFYDAFELPDGRVALTIGDVTGHGLAAAVIMGEIRQAIRAASFENAAPSAILDRASSLLIASGRTVFVTAIFGVLDPLTGRFIYATAGHPPPLLDHQGAITRLAAAGLPIGLRDNEGVDFALRLTAPCALVFYTDGLLEFARDIADGERRIEGAIRALGDSGTEHLANALMKTVLGDDEATDDIAILTVTIDRFPSALPGQEREWHFTSADAATGALVRHQVGELIAAWTGRDDATFPAELAFGELIANAVRHAPGLVRVAASCDEERNALLVVEDSGNGFTPGPQRLDPYAESGRGLGLMAAVSNGVRVEQTSRGGTRVSVVFGAADAALV